MKTIVCYGDSNTWGYMPKRERPEITADNRFPWGVRWTSLLQMKLGADYRVEEEGLNGRTTMFDDPLDICRNGLEYIDTVMLTKAPVDLVILMLGTNDVKEFFGMPPYVIARGCGRLIDRIQAGGYGPGGSAPQILLVAPLKLPETLSDSWLSDEFGAGAINRNDQLPGFYGKIAAEKGVHFLNAAEFVTADPADSIHMNEQGHAETAARMCAAVKEILG